jgi:hypothetical protein
MKTIHYFGLALLGLSLLATSCKEDPDIVLEPVATLKVLKGEMTLPPTGGEASFLISAEEAVQAVADFPSWCHVTVSGKERIDVSVDPHGGLESRYSGVTVTSNGETCYLTVHQFGVQVSLDNASAHLGNQALTLTRNYFSNAPMTFTSTVDWLHPVSEEDGVLSINVDENASKDYREGYVKYTCGEYADSISVVQFDPVDAGMLGDYSWVCLNVSTNRNLTLNSTFTLEEDTYYLSFVSGTALNCKTPVRLEGFKLLIPLGKVIGTYTARKVEHTVVPVIALTTTVAYGEAVTSGYYTLEFAKNEGGQWEARTFAEPASGSFMFGAWEASDLSGQSAAASIPMANVVMTHK